MHVILTFFVLTLTLFCIPLTSDIGRKNYSETVKNYCIDQWSAKEKINSLSKFSSLSEHCKCMQNEIGYSVNNEWAGIVIQIQIQIQIQTNYSKHKYLSDEVIESTFREWNAKYRVAHINF